MGCCGGSSKLAGSWAKTSSTCPYCRKNLKSTRELEGHKLWCLKNSKRKGLEVVRPMGHFGSKPAKLQVKAVT